MSFMVASMKPSIPHLRASGFLVTAVMALATAWTAASPFGQSLDPDAATRPVALRESIAEAVRLISSAK
jgi:hypothetical protein